MLCVLQTDDSRILCSMNGIIADGEKACTCYDCWEVRAHCAFSPSWSLLLLCASSSHILTGGTLQGDDCSLEVDIGHCNITAESGSPLLFGKACIIRHILHLCVKLP